MRNTRVWICGILGCMLSLDAATIHVSPTATDNGADGSGTRPFRSLNMASAAASPGDTILANALGRTIFPNRSLFSSVAPARLAAGFYLFGDARHAVVTCTRVDQAGFAGEARGQKPEAGRNCRKINGLHLTNLLRFFVDDTPEDSNSITLRAPVFIHFPLQTNSGREQRLMFDLCAP